MTDLSQFGKYGKKSSNYSVTTKDKVAIVYTRVSSKEQADNNLSLDVQRKVIEDYAQRNNISVFQYFGGTYESAKTDGRKEFLRMLDFIKKNKGKISHILVYTLDRFSRTGGGAIKLAEDLREKYGVTVFAVTQPTDTSNASGVLQQNIHFIFSQYDNQLRKQRAIAGMKEKFDKGIWVVRPPQGYDIVKTNGERKILVNAIGKKLRKAFVWKVDGLKNEDIIERLCAQGVKMYKQQLSKIFRNPFYCGLVCHGLMEGRVIEGTHEKLISKEIFMKVNNINENASGSGVPHKRERELLPLKVFVKCGVCGEPFTGYIVKAKNLWYYKCRKNGCKCNKSAVQLHKLFQEYIDQYSLETTLSEPLTNEIVEVWNEINKDNVVLEQNYKIQLLDVTKRLDKIEEKHYVLEEMNKETFQKFYFKYKQEQSNITEQLGKVNSEISNPMAIAEKAIGISLELPTMWASGDVKEKQRLQKLLFPQGIAFDLKTNAFRTERVNVIFLLMAELVNHTRGNEKGQTGLLSRLSLSAERQGFEPWIPFDRYTHFPGVPLQPLEHLSRRDYNKV